MNIPIPHVALTFGDFALLAILLTMMYALTALEVWLTPGGRTAAGASLVHRKNAATYAFFGIFLTLLAGALSSTRVGGTLYVLPFAFIAYWGYFHWRITRQLLDVEIIIEHFNNAYRKEVVAVLNGSPNVGLSLQQIHDSTVEREPYVKVITAGSPILKQVLPVAVGDIAKQLLPTRTKTEGVLQRLKDEGVVQCDSAGLYRLQALPSPQ